MQPHASELEEAIIGACLIEQEALLSTKSVKPGMKLASRRWKNMSFRRMCAEAGCCSATSERKTSITADNVMFALVTVQQIR